MVVISKIGNEIKEMLYPRMDISEPVIDINKKKVGGKLVDIDSLDESYQQLYFIQEIMPENTNIHRYDCVRQEDILTDNFHPEYKHLKICMREWKLVEKSKEVVIDNLNQLYGQYLDCQYPQPVRISHILELQSGTSESRKQYIESLQSWLLECKADREKRISEYLENNLFPSFDNYIVKP
jgi:hypothetical protein